MSSLPTLGNLPGVSVVMPVKNEASSLRASVDAVRACGYDGDLEIVLAVAPSDDETREIAAELAADPAVIVVDNEAGITPVAMNLAIAAATHDVIVRMDAHALMPDGYVDVAVEALRESGAANVGGRMVPEAPAGFGRAVAVAMSSVWGLGAAGHRQGGADGEAASVYLGSFHRAALDEVGGYDEHFVRAQDWELNYRLRQAGYRIWFDARMAVPYTPRSSWSALRRQFFTSGQWRREVTRTHPDTKSPRYLAAPAMVLATASALVLGVLGLLVGASALAWLLLVPGAYVAGVLVASATLAPRAGVASTWALPVVLATMHVAWGLGFLRGVR